MALQLTNVNQSDLELGSILVENQDDSVVTKELRVVYNQGSRENLLGWNRTNYPLHAKTGRTRRSCVQLEDTFKPNRGSAIDKSQSERLRTRSILVENQYNAAIRTDQPVAIRLCWMKTCIDAMKTTENALDNSATAVLYRGGNCVCGTDKALLIIRMKVSYSQ